LGKPGQADSANRARETVLDPILASPYRPAAREKPHIEAGHTPASDHMPTEGKIMLSFAGASIHVRRWSIKFGFSYAKTLRKTYPRADVRWTLDEVFVSINGKSMYLWRAVDCEGEVLDVLVQSRRNKRAALKLM
jgi:hypothetical protein